MLLNGNRRSQIKNENNNDISGFEYYVLNQIEKLDRRNLEIIDKLDGKVFVNDSEDILIDGEKKEILNLLLECLKVSQARLSLYKEVEKTIERHRQLKDTKEVLKLTKLKELCANHYELSLSDDQTGEEYNTTDIINAIRELYIYLPLQFENHIEDTLTKVYDMYIPKTLINKLVAMSNKDCVSLIVDDKYYITYNRNISEETYTQKIAPIIMKLSKNN